jgi:hypothetical protein
MQITLPSDPPAASPASETPFGVDLSVFAAGECVGRFHVPPGTYLIGSDPSCHLCLALDNVERMHARLSFYGHRIVVEDYARPGVLGSTMLRGQVTELLDLAALIQGYDPRFQLSRFAA